MATLSLRKNQRVALLRGVELFSGCSNTELGRIASLTTEHSAEPGQVLTERGEPGQEFFVIIEGEATATRQGRRLATLGPGSFFGELALLDGGKRTATVVADTEMRLLVLSRREFMSLYHAAPSVGNKMLVELGSRLRKTDDLLDPTLPLGTGVGSWSL
jgi:CRP/FNR family transcriptional regulator, cyclic AMP receptor protein